jgi:hypothetical protein
MELIMNIYSKLQFGTTMNDDDDELEKFMGNFDPFETLQNHDEWIKRIAEHMEQLARAGSANATHLEQNINLVRQLVRGYEHMNQKIRWLDERITRLENPQ